MLDYGELCAPINDLVQYMFGQETGISGFCFTLLCIGFIDLKLLQAYCLHVPYFSVHKPRLINGGLGVLEKNRRNISDIMLTIRVELKLFHHSG